MSTAKYNNKSNKGLYLSRFYQIAKLGITVFHVNDLANLWQIKDPNNLHTTLKRYVQKGLLIRIYRGLYSLKPVEQLDSALVGMKALHRYAYVSTETVLAQAGIIQQKIDQVTLVSSISKKFFVGSFNFHSRQLADKFLYNEIGIINENGAKKASAERAVADLLYFNPSAYFDAEKLIDWKKVKIVQKAIGYPLTFNRY
ncbi:MAG: type IV toxin-antitoxin system AbiEi family antitoxin domain-containing protein [Parcubacteria group bacterium]